MAVFKTAAFNRSATTPGVLNLLSAWQFRNPAHVRSPVARLLGIREGVIVCARADPSTDLTAAACVLDPP